MNALFHFIGENPVLSIILAIVIFAGAEGIIRACKGNKDE